MLFEGLHLDCSLEPNQRILGVLFKLLLEPLLAILVLEVVDDVVEGLRLAEQFLALAAALDGVSCGHEDRHLLKKFIFSILAMHYFILSLE